MATSITIRNVPDDVRDELAARARRSGRSLQEYLQGELARLAARPSAEDLMSQVVERKRRTGSHLPSERILELRDAERP